MQESFDVMLCRRVMIYFDKSIQARLVSRFSALLAPGGYFLVGHSENLSGWHHDLAFVQPTTFRRLITTHIAHSDA